MACFTHAASCRSSYHPIHIELSVEPEGACPKRSNLHREPAEYRYGRLSFRLFCCSTPGCCILTLNSAITWRCNCAFAPEHTVVREMTVNIWIDSGATYIFKKYTRLTLPRMMNVERPMSTIPLNRFKWKSSQWADGLVLAHSRFVWIPYRLCVRYTGAWHRTLLTTVNLGALGRIEANSGL